MIGIWGSPFLYRRTSNYEILLTSGGPGENRPYTLSTLVNHYLSVCNCKTYAYSKSKYLATSNKQIKAKPRTIVDGRSPEKARPISGIKFLILRIKKDLFIQNITSGFCSPHQTYRLLKTKLKSKLNVSGGKYDERKTA